MRKITCLAVMLVLATSSFAFAQNAASNKEGRTSSSARATIKAWVEIDGVPMKPAVLVSPGPKPPRVVEGVVYADRLQATGLDVNLACTITVVGTTGTCAVTGDVTLD